MNTHNVSFSLRWLFVDMNSYFASCEQQMDPALRGWPVVVAPVMTDSTCAIAASYEAKAFGIKTGTPIWEAKKKCPDLKVVPAQHKLYVDLHHKIIAAVDTCVPVEAVVSIDEVACKLDAFQCDPPKAYALGVQVKAAIRDRVGNHLKCSIGIASNRLLAKLASDIQKPDGLTILHPEQMPQPILHLKPKDICGIGHNMNERLRRADIHTMEDLWKADVTTLRRIWGGIYGVRFHSLLHGVDIAAPAKSPTRSMSHQHVLPPAQRSKENAAAVMRQLLVRVAQRLRDSGMYTQRMSIHIKWTDHLGHHGDEATFQETQDSGFLLPILAKLWDRIPPLKPHRIGVTLWGLTTHQTHQPDLFDRPKPLQLVKALDTLNQKFGRGTVGYGTATPAMGSKIAFSRVPTMDEF